MVKIVLKKEEQEILKGLIENEKSTFEVIEDKKGVPKKLKEYKKELDSLSDKIDYARSV